MLGEGQSLIITDSSMCVVKKSAVSLVRKSVKSVHSRLPHLSKCFCMYSVQCTAHNQNITGNERVRWYCTVLRSCMRHSELYMQVCLQCTGWEFHLYWVVHSGQRKSPRLQPYSSRLTSIINFLQFNRYIGKSIHFEQTTSSTEKITIQYFISFWHHVYTRCDHTRLFRMTIH